MFWLFLGSTTILWVGNYSWIQTKWLLLPDKVLKCVCRSLLYMSKFGVLDMSESSVFSLYFNRSILILLYFGCMLTETAASCERLASVPFTADAWRLPPTEKKRLSVVTQPVTSEGKRVSFFCCDGSFLQIRYPFSGQRLLGVSTIFILLFNLI